jgi:hypothetical protein
VAVCRERPGPQCEWKLADWGYNNGGTFRELRACKMGRIIEGQGRPSSGRPTTQTQRAGHPGVFRSI